MMVVEVGNAAGLALVLQVLATAGMSASARVPRVAVWVSVCGSGNDGVTGRRVEWLATWRLPRHRTSLARNSLLLSFLRTPLSPGVAEAATQSPEGVSYGILAVQRAISASLLFSSSAAFDKALHNDGEGREAGVVC